MHHVVQCAFVLCSLLAIQQNRFWQVSTRGGNLILAVKVFQIFIMVVEDLAGIELY